MPIDSAPLTTHHSLFIGTSGWSYDDWKSIVYPGTGHVDPLVFMARYFNALEINASFYRDVAPKTAEGWLQRLDRLADFRFTAKVHQRFTHQRSEPFDAQDARRSLEGFEPLLAADRLGALLAQFPWSFRDEPNNRDWLRHIRDAFDRCPLVVELRHDSWLQEESADFLRSLAVGFCNIDQPHHSHCIPPTELVFSPVGYVRLHGRNHARWFDHEDASQRYDYLYTDHELDEWMPRIRRIVEQTQTTFVFANNHFRGQAVANALQMRAKLSGDRVEVPPGLLDHYPDLDRIARPGQHERQGRLF
ncbi:MAG: DUF72 domain-containing protein [Planctomycetes bacterium]|nr:DUF72 domain-containing protein [Planctomycetota bacterium]